MNMKENLNKPYNSKDTEDSIYKMWFDSNLFNPDECIKKGVTKEDAPHFSMVLPPPNVTGSLHMGSAYMLALEDIMTRFARMQGKKTLWLPGTDHAAIATQSKVEKEIQKKEGKNRYDIGRDELLKRIDTFAKESHDTIVSQTKKMGASLDWSREAFTLDEKRSRAVNTAFKKMYDDGLIYRGYRIVNWDPKGQTTISDDEIVSEERKAKLYTFKYSKSFPISIATTRPETKVGDVAVAVHPEDERYQKYIGKEYDELFYGVPIHIKIIADEKIEKDFGTGALGVTPAHSQIDWDMAQKNNLPIQPVINEYAKMTVGGENLLNKKTTEARELIVEWLKSEGLLEKEEEITQNIPTAERTGGIIEPLPKLQWFIDVNKKIPYRNNKSLKELMLKPVRNKNISILPDRFEKVYFNWIENLRDWCISRQIWYGHRIPVWYSSTSLTASKEDKIYCGIENPGEGWVQDEDTLDTWFSSGLWSFSTLGWPDNTEDLKNYHPTTVLETGYDILFFWVARMILMSTYLVGQVPFKTVYLHGLVRDAQGRKISKSLGNNIDPVEMIEQYGADAVRMALVVGTGPGNDSKMSPEKLKAYKHFANKIWNIARFVFENNPNIYSDENKASTDEDNKKYIEEWKEIAKSITEDMDQFRFYIAAEKIYHYTWHTFADIILENSKPKLKDEGDKKESTQNMLGFLFKEQLKVLHPFMPFITESIWQMIPSQSTEKTKMLMIEKWPVYNE